MGLGENEMLVTVTVEVEGFKSTQSIEVWGVGNKEFRAEGFDAGLEVAGKHVRAALTSKHAERRDKSMRAIFQYSEGLVT